MLTIETLGQGVKYFKVNNKDARTTLMALIVFDAYRKKTSNGASTNFSRFIPGTYKISLTKSLIFKCSGLCLDFVKLHHEVDIIKRTSHENS